jgi:hypothetical protein
MADALQTVRIKRDYYPAKPMQWSDITFKEFTIVGDLVLTFSLFLSLKNIDCLYSLAGFLYNFPLD